MVFTPDGRYAFVANMGSTLMSKIDVRNGHKLIKNYKVGLTPRHIVISKDGQFLYISLNRPGNIVKFDIQEERVVKNIHVGHHPRTIVLSPDDQELYVVLYKDNKFLALSTDTLKPLRKYSTGHHPVGIDVTPDGKEIWVANYGSSSLGIFNVIP
jgi:DNA-binding beta-propeller fold protein YncE